MTINITIPNAKVPRLLESLGYTAEIGTPEVFLKNTIKNTLVNSVIAFETHKAAQELVPTDLNIT